MVTKAPCADAAITKGVVTAAGSGTRFLPATKAIPKEMIPLIDRPIIQYVVEELAASGVEDVVFVTRWDKKVLEDHFDQHPTLEDDLAASGKRRHLDETRRPSQLANVAYIRQRGPYGNGTPALNAAYLLGDAPFIYAFGDDLVSAKTPFAAPTRRTVSKDARRHSGRSGSSDKRSAQLRHGGDGRRLACHQDRRKNRPPTR